MNMSATSIKKGTITLAIVAFLAVGALGIGNFGMSMNDGQMSDCPFMGVPALCKMNPLEHIAAWQNMFAAVPSRTVTILAVLLLLALFVAYLKDFWSIKEQKRAVVFNQRFREKTLVARSPLQEAFSSGILHPKIF